MGQSPPLSRAWQVLNAVGCAFAGRRYPAGTVGPCAAPAAALPVRVAEALRSAKLRIALSLSGTTINHDTLLLRDLAALDLLTFAANCLARAEAPPPILLPSPCPV